MQSGIIREFLVKLGYKMDDASERRMRESIDKLTDRVKDLAKAGAVMATAVGVAVAKVANDLDGLYFASKRIGASAGNIKAFEYAIKQMGGSGESARAALEGLARFMRNSPGAESWISGLGVKTRDSNGNLRDTVDIYADLAGVLKGMDSSQANAVAQVLGLDDTTLQAIRSGDMAKYMSEYLAQIKASGVDLDQAAKNAQAYAEVLRGLEMRFNALTTVVGSKALPTIQAFTKELSGNLDKLTQWLSKHDAVEMLGTIKKTPPGKGTTGSETADRWIKGTWWEYLLHGSMSDTHAPVEGAERRRGSGRIGGGSGVGDKKAMAIAFFRSMEWSQAQAAGIVANLSHESGMNPLAVGDNGQAFGIAQWHPDRQANFKKWAGKDIRDSTLQDQLGFVQYELTRGAEQRAGAMLLAARNAQDAGSVMSRYYERPLAADAEAAKRGASAVQLSAQTVIHVNGASDPMSTAQVVASQQTRVAQDQARNFSAVMQ